MPQFINFYENLAEAKIRLEQTYVMYDGKPYFAVVLGDHSDGKIRIYLDDYEGGAFIRNRDGSFPYYANYHTTDYPQVVDEWYKNNPKTGLIRKEIGSPLFNKFRPFPLGNMNYGGSVIYTERTPTRNTNQGLRERSVYALNVLPVPNPTSSNSGSKRSGSHSYNNETSIDIACSEFYDTMCGRYPSITEVLEAFRDPSVINTGVAFHREFSVFRGPLDMLILCYRDEGIGLLTNGDLSSVTIGKNYAYLKEVIQELGCFQQVICK
jgi:hypothetical protein